jgi:outer membrane protein insertion porin family
LAGTVELQFPVPFLSESKNIRLGAFVDAGNVYCNFFEVPGPGKNPSYPYDTNCYAPAKGDFVRYSAGLSARWLSPFGNLAFSIAEPLNTVTGDRTQAFQFTFGQGF